MRGSLTAAKVHGELIISRLPGAVDSLHNGLRRGRAYGWVTVKDGGKASNEHVVTARYHPLRKRQRVPVVRGVRMGAARRRSISGPGRLGRVRLSHDATARLYE